MTVTPDTRHILRTELAGAVVMTVAGSALHFAFAWSGHWAPMALIAAVNESIWEHLKLAFWPGVLWALLAPYRGVPRRAVLAAKGISLAVTAALIVAVFQSYTAILGRNLLVLDIGTFVGAIVAGQGVSAWLLLRGGGMRRVGLALLLGQLVAYSLCTYAPPDHWLFIEERSGLRGIPEGSSQAAVPRGAGPGEITLRSR